MIVARKVLAAKIKRRMFHTRRWLCRAEFHSYENCYQIQLSEIYLGNLPKIQI